ncbi:MAG: D-alanine--D-alanine ligase [Planctomycetota bacterium]|nr:D-alanine--D-alanine ligase [Planctomycetota bacterium]
MATIVRHGRRFNSRDHSDPLNHAAVGVLYGGPSAEREISMQSGDAVATALEQAGRNVQRVILDGSFDAKMARGLGIDVAFLALHGEFGEDGRIQFILEQAGIPYTGSGPDASAQAFDKMLAKRAYESHGVLTPAWMCFDREELAAMGPRALNDLAPPVVVKPAACGSSLGVTIVRHPDQAPAALKLALEFGDSVLVERFVPGREVTVAILGDEPLPVAELKLQREFYDFTAKYEDDATRIVCPAELSREMTARAQASALAAHQALGCCDVSRTDLILDAHGLFWVLETNTLPGLTSHSLLPKACAEVGTSFLELAEFLLIKALARGAGKGRQAA